MITGTGIDIVNINRIKKSLADHGDRFTGKILSGQEIENIPSTRKEEYIAGRFAAKEALVKAAGSSLDFISITILNNEKGKPFISEIPDNLKGKKIHLSISHDTDYAAAFVIIEE
jgi:holo-[acyl-carrier protein] synthase